MSLNSTGDEAEVTIASAMKNAARLLHNAELETDLAKMERVEKLADSWVNIATVLTMRESSES